MFDDVQYFRSNFQRNAAAHSFECELDAQILWNAVVSRINEFMDIIEVYAYVWNIQFTVNHKHVALII